MGKLEAAKQHPHRDLEHRQPPVPSSRHQMKVLMEEWSSKWKETADLLKDSQLELKEKHYDKVRSG